MCKDVEGALYALLNTEELGHNKLKASTVMVVGGRGEGWGRRVARLCGDDLQMLEGWARVEACVPEGGGGHLDVTGPPATLDVDPVLGLHAGMVVGALYVTVLLQSRKLADCRELWLKQERRENCANILASIMSRTQ